jgi:hypothetical protein
MSLTMAATADSIAVPAEDGTTPTTVPLAALAASRATTFLRAQAQWLERGLVRADDPIAVDLVIGAHDRSHDRWVATIQIVSAALGEDAADDVAAVYTFVGRIAGSLERGAMDLLEPEVAAQVREYLAERLEDLTETTVDMLWQAAAEG